VYMSIISHPDADYTLGRQLFWGRTFGLFINESRDKTGRSVEEAALLAGMEARSWRAMEAGIAPDHEQLHPVADALELGYDVVEMLAVFCEYAWDD